jgi:hypothetical protein
MREVDLTGILKQTRASLQMRKFVGTSGRSTLGNDIFEICFTATSESFAAQTKVSSLFTDEVLVKHIHVHSAEDMDVIN